MNWIHALGYIGYIAAEQIKESKTFVLAKAIYSLYSTFSTKL